MSITQPPTGIGDWDPEPKERFYVRHKEQGDLGWLVRRNGVAMVRLDRPGEILHGLSDRWEPAGEVRRFNRYQASLVAFEADKAMRHTMGDHAGGRMDWLSLSDKERNKWNSEGPGKKADPERQRLWETIIEFFGV
jgi:hypothetical protein